MNELNVILPKSDRTNPATPVLIPGTGNRITWQDLKEKTAYWQEQFGQERKLIALAAERNAESIFAYLAGIESGHVMAMLPPNDAQALKAFERDFAPDISVCFQNGLPEIRQSHSVVPCELHPDLCLLLPTSGSTGVSKVVRLSRQNVESNAQAIIDYLNLTEHDRSALILPLHYSYGLSVLHSHLKAGASLYIPDGSVLEAGFARTVADNQCTNISGVPHSFRLLEETDFRSHEIPSLRFMTVAGGRASPETITQYTHFLRKSGGEFFAMYGQTEATARIAYLPPEDAVHHADTIGQAIPGGTLKLLNEDGREITKAGETGELVYSGPNVMMGYALDRNDLSKGQETDELRTGDLATRDDRGFYKIVGRLKRISKISGLRIGHDSVEAALAGHDIEAIVTGNDSKLSVLHCSSYEDEHVRKLVADITKLPNLAIEVLYNENLPLLASGKVDYEKAKSLFSSARQTSPSSVQQLYSDIFAPKTVKPDDSFVSLGGDSLRFVELSIALEKLLGTLPDKWEEQSITALGNTRAGSKSYLTIGTDLLIRAISILLVVVHHATHWPIPGGAAAMTVLIGLGLARFHWDAVVNGNPGRLLNGIPLVLFPYSLVLMGYTIGYEQFPWASALLVGNLGLVHPLDREMLPFLYWFVELYVQSVLLIYLLLCISSVRDYAKNNSFEFALALIGLGLLLRFGLAETWDFSGRQIFTLPWNFYLVGFGWAICFAKTTRQKLTLLVLGLIAFPAAAYFGGNMTPGWVKYSLQIVVIVALLFLPRAKVHKVVATAVLSVAAAGYHIYLFHRIIPKHFPEWLGKEQFPELFIPLSILIGVLCGFAAWYLQGILLKLAKGSFSFEQLRMKVKTLR
ncbi:AMP-binding protein [Kiloniella sp. b19]|uniref:AMP-binding protein n=1 Tax=Kiloniella sp. GXU_MW_B19 TaxID=3141326 RepID=UPI0031E07AC1